MFVVCYLAQDDRFATALRARLALAKQPKVLLLAHSIPELISQVQTLPVKVIIADIAWPRASWRLLFDDLHCTNAAIPVFALSPGACDYEWWQFAHDLLRLDENPELFLFRIERAEESYQALHQQDATPLASTHYPSISANTLPAGQKEPQGLLENSQFRQLTEIFSGVEDSMMIETFASWLQQVCQTSRIMILLRNQDTGEFICRAQRGLPTTLIPHCRFQQTSALCQWLTTTGHILMRDTNFYSPPADVLNSLQLMQTEVAIPMMYDGQLVGILCIGPRLIGHGYNVTELEGLYSISGQMATALHNCRIHRLLCTQQEMTEHILSVMPAGVIVLDEENRIAFINAAAADIMGTVPSALLSMDLRALPSPLGDLAYETLSCSRNLPRRELILVTTARPVAVTSFLLGTESPKSMLLLEDLSSERQLLEERERRVDLEVVTNLVHYLAHELRNPLVALATFNTLMPLRADDSDFQEFCKSVLPVEISRINLVLEQLLVLTNHAEFRFTSVDFSALIDRVLCTPEMESVVEILSQPQVTIYGDAQRLETALTCLFRSLIRFAKPQTMVSLQIDEQAPELVIRLESEPAIKVSPEKMLNPWHQLIGGAEEEIDFGFATAQFIFEQHGGTLKVTATDKVLTCLCQLPTGRSSEEQKEIFYGANSKSANSR